MLKLSISIHFLSCYVHCSQSIQKKMPLLSTTWCFKPLNFGSFRVSRFQTFLFKGAPKGTHGLYRQIWESHHLKMILEGNSMEFPGENRYIFLGEKMFGFETQSEIVGWQKSGTTGNWWTTMDWNLDQLCFIYIYIWTRENQSGLCKADLDILVYNLRVNDCECDGKYPRLALLQLGDFLFFFSDAWYLNYMV